MYYSKHWLVICWLRVKAWLVPDKNRALEVASYQPLPEIIENRALLSLQMPLTTWDLCFRH